MDERDYKSMNKHENGNEVLADVSNWAYFKRNKTVLPTKKKNNSANLLLGAVKT